MPVSYTHLSAKAITFGDDKSVRLLRDKASHGIYAVQLFGACLLYTSRCV